MYLTLKFLHIIGVILFLGNITTGVFWKAHADRTRDPRLIAHVLDGIIRSDRYFTIPGVVIILVSGFAAALSAGIPLLRTAWTAGGIALFTIAGISFMARVAPLQQQMLKLARSSTDATHSIGSRTRNSRAAGRSGARRRSLLPSSLRG